VKRTRLPVRVRAATAADRGPLEALFRVVTQAHARMAPGFFRGTPPGGRAGAPLGRLDGADEAVLVADQAGGVVGLVHIQLYDTPTQAELAPRRRVYIEELVVAPDHRRCGVGRALMAAAGRWGTQRGATQVVLTVWARNGGAHRFYRALGFGDVSRVMALDLQ
jgi:ribosomal protein S18 acetylase RimI-like enzyme